MLPTLRRAAAPRRATPRRAVAPWWLLSLLLHPDQSTAPPWVSLPWMPLSLVPSRRLWIRRADVGALRLHLLLLILDHALFWASHIVGDPLAAPGREHWKRQNFSPAPGGTYSASRASAQDAEHAGKV